MRRILALLCIGASVLFLAPTAVAQPTVDEVVDDVRVDGVYVERGADADAGDIADVLQGVTDVAVVVLAADDPDGAQTAADQVRTALGIDLVVLVVSPGELGHSESDVFTDDELGAAIDAAADTFEDGGSTTEAVESFLRELDAAIDGGSRPLPDLDDDGAGDAGTAAGGSNTAASGSNTGGDSGGGGIGGFLIFLLVIVGLIGGFIWWAKRKANKVDTDEIDTAKAEIRSQLESVAHDIVEHEHEVDLSGDEQAIEYYRSAGATYNRVGEAVEETDNLLELAGLNDDIDRARWQLEAAMALVEGRPVPPQPEPEKPGACFFDPTHRPGTEECTIKTSAGDKEVRVCRECASKLQKGERPEPRMIDVGGRRVPAAKAPRSHGGLGMGGLSIFEVILGGLGALAAARGSGSRAQQRASSDRSGVGLDWGDMLPKRRSSGNVFGPDRQPPRPRGLPRTSASRDRSRTRTRKRPAGRRRSDRSRTRTRTRRR